MQLPLLFDARDPGHVCREGEAAGQARASQPESSRHDGMQSVRPYDNTAVKRRPFSVVRSDDHAADRSPLVQQVFHRRPLPYLCAGVLGGLPQDRI